MFMVERTTFHINRDPLLTNLTLEAAIEKFGLLDLPCTIHQFLHCKSTQTEPTSQDPQHTTCSDLISLPFT